MSFVLSFCCSAFIIQLKNQSRAESSPWNWHSLIVKKCFYVVTRVIPVFEVTTVSRCPLDSSDSSPCETASCVWLITRLLCNACFHAAERQAIFCQMKLTRARSQDRKACLCACVCVFVLCVSADSTVTDAPHSLYLMPLVRGPPAFKNK